MAALVNRYAGDIYKDEIRGPKPIRNSARIRYRAVYSRPKASRRILKRQPESARQGNQRNKKAKVVKVPAGVSQIAKVHCGPTLKRIPKPCSSHTRVKVKIGGNIHELGRAVPRHYFGPILTAWLLAMGPHVTHRVFVIRKAIEKPKSIL